MTRQRVPCDVAHALHDLGVRLAGWVVGDERQSFALRQNQNLFFGGRTDHDGLLGFGVVMRTYDSERDEGKQYGNDCRKGIA